ncbi:MAG TPA: hypothetical protein VLY87_02755, partial [Flavobacterium sp.]|nr:hypothetical protein [Flavobacterium sp.]
LKSPVMVGYFTDRAQAESYRSSLADVAPNAQFSLKEVEIKVKEKSTSQVQNTASNVDFWGVKKADSETKQETNTEVDFWGNPVEKNKTETQKTETTKNNDFWSR